MQIQPADTQQRSQWKPTHLLWRLNAAQQPQNRNPSITALAVSPGTMNKLVRVSIPTFPTLSTHSWLLHPVSFPSPAARPLGAVSEQIQTPCNKFITSPPWLPRHHCCETTTALKTQNELNNKYCSFCSPQ